MSQRDIDLNRKKSLIRPERTRLNPEHPQYHYAQVAAQQAGRINVHPSSTGNDPIIETHGAAGAIPLNDFSPSDEEAPEKDEEDTDGKGGRNYYGLNDEVEPGSYGPSNMTSAGGAKTPLAPEYNQALPPGQKVPRQTYEDHSFDFWPIYCKAITFWAPAPLLRLFGLKTPERQMGWREKIGLITVILYVATFVAYLTFGFTKTVCSNQAMRMHNSEINDAYLVVNGRAYDLSKSTHPQAAGISAGSNILYPPVNAGGMDASFLFQNVNGKCKGLITPKSTCTIPHSGDNLAYYMPCKVFALDGSTKPNFTEEYYKGYACHTSATARNTYYDLKVVGNVYFTWDDIKNSSRELIVYSGNVLDLSLLDWLLTDEVDYPSRFDQLRNDTKVHGYDISQYMTHGEDAQVIKCINQIAKVGYIDSESIGCIASKVVLVISLIFIIGIVVIKFFLALYFKWVVSPRQGAFYVSNKEMRHRDEQIEDWSDNMNANGPVKKAPRMPIFKRGTGSSNKNRRSVTMSIQVPYASTSKLAPGGNLYQQGNGSRNSLMISNSPEYGYSSEHTGQPSLFSLDTTYRSNNVLSDSEDYVDETYDPDYVVPQPPIDYQPFGYPLAHTICLVTAYSESEEGLRVTLDSVATTDYPNSHKLLLIICDGLIKGSGNSLTTPEIALSMMKDFAEPVEEVKPYSYVSVVTGSKRHNMAKVYSGFYNYDDSTVDPSRQQRVPMMVIVKCGTPAEEGTPKPGNRGKRDSQIILMSFFQKVMFDERMTELDYEIFNGIWRITGVAPDFYEIVLMVDADTKVYPDSLTHMVAAMVKDPEIMGLCGETKIANKSESWVTMIQVFEYFISHHQAKAFESVFGNVTCLPGCFCMYRIKAPKGDDGYWVPILANPDIVERYADNKVDTLHKKNLLLLGEDRFLTTLMLRTFPKRRQIFIPKAACKTIVPAQFKVLLSQRRRWINSTVHNLFELALVRDLCGVFCISMQFVVFIDLISTLVLPAAICFTIYVVVIAIVSKPTPIMSLVLLGLILGLPGLLVVVTASRPSYIGWMLIYLLALPIWNLVLPVYAYWKFDDISWGETRTIQGGDKKGHGDNDGEFDSSQIVMKRWREFERDQQRNIAVPNPVWSGDHVPSLTTTSGSVLRTHSPAKSSSSSTEDVTDENKTPLKSKSSTDDFTDDRTTAVGGSSD